MSTKNEMLGKENRKEKGHRRYSLLLLALLFIGFASYGTYAYFTSSASTQHGHLTLNGSSGKYDFNGGGTDKDGKITDQSGDGLADENTPVYHNPGENGEGSFVKNGVDNTVKYGEFDWVYIGNAGKDFSNDSVYPTALAQTNQWQFNNKVVFTSDEYGDIFNSVTGGDVFRKTVRLQVKGSGDQKANVLVDWNGNNVDLTNISARMNVKIGENSASQDLTADKTSTILGAAEGTDNTLVAKAGDTIEITLVAYVSNKNLSIEGTNQLLGQIQRNLTISLAQNRDLANKSNK